MRAMLRCETGIVHFLCLHQAAFNLQIIKANISNSNLYGRVMTDGRKKKHGLFTLDRPKLGQSLHNLSPSLSTPIRSSACRPVCLEPVHPCTKKAGGQWMRSRNSAVQLTGHDPAFNTFCCQPCIARYTRKIRLALKWNKQIEIL